MMATETQADNAGKSGERSGQGPGIVVTLVVSLAVGGAAGAGYGLLMPPKANQPTAPPAAVHDTEKAEKHEAGPPAAGRFPKDAVEIAVPSIITTIANGRTNVRLDLSLVAVHGTAAETLLKSEIREDVIAYLRGVKIEDLAGGRGFLDLRAQLDERARIRGRGAVLGLLVGGLIIQ